MQNLSITLSSSSRVKSNHDDRNILLIFKNQSRFKQMYCVCINTFMQTANTVLNDLLRSLKLILSLNYFVG